MRERSLSPMELDSVSGSPDVSPNSTPKTIRSQLERFATPPRSPTSSIASSSGFQDVPVDPPLYVNGVKGAEPRTKYEGSMSSDSSTSAPGKPEMGARTITSSLNQSVNGKADPKKPVYNNFVPAKHATGPSASMEGNAPATTEILTTTQKVSGCLDLAAYLQHDFLLYDSLCLRYYSRFCHLVILLNLIPVTRVQQLEKPICSCKMRLLQLVGIRRIKWTYWPITSIPCQILQSSPLH